MQTEPGKRLSDLTSLRLGGVASEFFTVAEREDLLSATKFIKERKLTWRVLGGGTNVLVADAGFPGMVLHMSLQGIDSQEKGDKIILTAAAGENLDDLVAYTVEQGWGGMESLSSIPGTVGATPVQNVGAYGVEVADLIVEVEVWDFANEVFRILTNADCQFAYRDSVFKHPEGSDLVVTAVTFALDAQPHINLQYQDLQRYFANQPDDQELTLVDVRRAVQEIRRGKFPPLDGEVGTAGSFFKNPLISPKVAANLVEKYPGLPVYPDSATGQCKISLAYLLDKVLGLKGYREGQVALYEQQPLILVTYPGATTTEVESFAKSITAKVAAATGVVIEREVRSW